ncbi:MAG: aminomethyl-transferring glycine dehydrogenase subunit GcvPA [Chloroflexi bacterium]|nr:aminomethyl-transferring glycine dehydrogenase subunit GcvPA [Chloroflexota bacterium]
MNYLPHTGAEIKEMLEVVGAESVEELFCDIPHGVRLYDDLSLPGPLSEFEIQELMQSLSRQNRPDGENGFFLGAGAYRHFIPAAVDSIISRGEFFTAYTPYQAEASQGTLQAIFEFQTAVSGLTGLDVANASLYDGASSLAEAAQMAVMAKGKKLIMVSEGVHPEYLQTLKTYLAGKDYLVEMIPLNEGLTDLDQVKDRFPEAAAVAVQNPNFFGCLEDLSAIFNVTKEKGALGIAVISDPVTLGFLRSPGESGCDVAVGEGQPLGLPMSFGGPGFGFVAARAEHTRRLPGRIVGRTADKDGRVAYCLTLQTREQHIRREKAASNICTNQALAALAATVYLSLMGPYGLRKAAELSARLAHLAAHRICDIPGFSLLFDRPFFHEFAVRCPKDPAVLNGKLRDYGIAGGLPLKRFYPAMEDAMLFTLTECNRPEEIDRLASALREITA